MSTEDDRHLLTRIATGDTQAMRALYERHHSALLGFIRSRGGDDTTADDVLHDTMLDVWRNANKFQGRSSVKTWIFTIARNKLIDRMRSAARVSLVAEVPDVVDDSPDAETIMESAQNVARVRACLDKLKEVQRTVIRLAFYEGLTYEDIAEIEGVPAGTIKSRVFHAKKALMKCLGRRDPVRAATPS